MPVGGAASGPHCTSTHWTRSHPDLSGHRYSPPIGILPCDSHSPIGTLELQLTLFIVSPTPSETNQFRCRCFLIAGGTGHNPAPFGSIDTKDGTPFSLIVDLTPVILSFHSSPAWLLRSTTSKMPLQSQQCTTSRTKRFGRPNGKPLYENRSAARLVILTCARLRWEFTPSCSVRSRTSSPSLKRLSRSDQKTQPDARLN